MTLQDYGPLCTTLRLFDVDGRLCERLDVGEECALHNADAPATRRPFVEDTLHYEIPKWYSRLKGHRWPNRYDRLVRRVSDWSVRKVDAEPLASADPSALAFQRRRDVNVERLGRVDRLVAQSPRVAEIYRGRGVAPDRLGTLRFTLAHIEHLRPRSLTTPPERATFATLGGCAGRTKGAHVVAGAVRALREAGLEGRFRLLVFGGVHDDVRSELESCAGVEIPELYTRDALGDLLEEVDVGIMPSIWEEAFGYTGLEMLAKGIPLIANPVGGIVEYARQGETAWLNESRSAEGLAELMSMLIADPLQIVEMHARVVAARDTVIRPMAEHVDAIYRVYAEASGALPAADPVP
jgi:glycosyltransferase involved in cell wall biosynthesis